jgi:hypothetical protein
MDVLIRLAQHYYPGTTTTGVDKVLDGRKREDYLNNIQSSFEIDDNESEEAVRYKTLKLDQVKLNISSIGMKKELIEGKKYQVAFFSQNAISLTEDLQIVLRFSGNVTQIHKTFDFVHATYFTFEEGLVTNVAALESILTKSLRYQGSYILLPL